MAELRHVLESQQFDLPMMQALFDRAAALRHENPDWQEVSGQYLDILDNSRLKNMVVLLYFGQPSSRTYVSFYMAGLRLGMKVLPLFSEFSSQVKGESFEDTIRVLDQFYPHVIVVRNKAEGELKKIALTRAISTPMINAGEGEGRGQHPFEALLGVYSIRRRPEIPNLENLNVTVGGDLLNGRAPRSFVYLMAKFPGTRFTFVSAPGLEIGEVLKEYLNRRQVPFEETHDVRESLKIADVVYWTRVQRNLLLPDVDYEQAARHIQITPKEMKLMKEHAVLTHPLPRDKDIPDLDPSCDDDPRAIYHNQTANRISLAMALLEYVVGYLDLP